MLMTDEDRQTLRLLVAEAVAGELTQQLAPLRERTQILTGQVRQLDQEYGAWKNMVERHEQVIVGDPKIGVSGLVKQVADLTAAVELLNTNITGWQNQVKGMRYALYIVGSVISVPSVFSALKLFGLVP